ncbi:xylulokinase [Microcoleus sp. FACHB-1515]|uniref:xylulokinase n=1 Tax=Cyanophyceae TaxID=3028117 RepID=UPI001689230B|nr:xylulokinase [Microcoleus sp. FACHB-1515]MBD2090307.1 xylulokinase [Microcoleus sp. FACHB-1515]
MLLGLDFGTSSVKALLLSIEGAVLAEASQPYPVDTPQPNWAETDPQAWWNAAAIAVRSIAQGQSVQAIGLSGQMHGVVLATATGAPLRPAILWADTRSHPAIATYQQLDLEMRRRLANPIAAGMAGTSLLWLRDREPEIYRAARWALQPKDWIRLRLTGIAAAEPSDASATLLYDLPSDRWAEDIAAALNLRFDWLAPIAPSSQIAGHLTSEAAELFNLPAGIPVAAGAGDTAAALVGSGLTESGLAQLTIGTAAQIAAIRSQPAIDLQTGTHLFRSALPQQWYSLAAMQNAGLALEWVRQILGYSWPQIYAEAFAIEPGCAGLTFLPYLTGERTPHLDPQIRGSWMGLSLVHTRAHLMRSSLEGVAFAIRQGLDALRSTGIAIESLRLAGGGSLEPQWRQLLADVLQVPLHSMSLSAASAQGAARLAGMAIGLEFNAPQIAQATVPRSIARLEAAYQRFCQLYPRLAGFRST